MKWEINEGDDHLLWNDTDQILAIVWATHRNPPTWMITTAHYDPAMQIEYQTLEEAKEVALVGAVSRRMGS